MTTPKPGAPQVTEVPPDPYFERIRQTLARAEANLNQNAPDRAQATATIAIGWLLLDMAEHRRDY